MRVTRMLFSPVLAFTLFAQQAAPPQPQEPAQPSDTVIRTTVDVVVAPVTVFDSNGSLVNGLQPAQFHLYDNEKEQDIRVDVTYQPISVVLVIQASANVEAVLPQVRRIGSLLKPIMIGDQGEAAVIAFDHRLRRMQEFTNDADKINEALKKIQAGSYTSRQVDAVNDAINMLRSRPPNRRRIVLLVSETRGKGNEGRVRDVLIASQVHNVIIYAVDISRMVTSLTAKQQAPRPDPLPPPARQGTMPAGVPATPTTVAQTFGGQGGRAEFIPLFVEILKDVKSIFVDNPSEVLTKGSGGAEYSFFRQRGLEDAIEKMGEELHSQYLIAYTPNNKDEGGFHQIDVTITGRRDLKVRTRPGYWLATKQ